MAKRKLPKQRIPATLSDAMFVGDDFGAWLDLRTPYGVLAIVVDRLTLARIARLSARAPRPMPSPE